MYDVLIDAELREQSGWMANMKKYLAIFVFCCSMGQLVNAQEARVDAERQLAADRTATSPAHDSSVSQSSYPDGAGGVYVEDHSLWGDE